MDEYSLMSKLDLENFNPEMSFQITLDNYKDKNVNNNPSIDLISNDLKMKLKKDISDSVMNLTQCFICLSIAEHPLSCPKCNNFACKKCLEDYFGDENEKKCPLCKSVINKNELVKNKTIREVEKILYKKDTKNHKIRELAKLYEEKKKMWGNPGEYINNLINKIIQYQENLKNYKKMYQIFLNNWKKAIYDVLKQYEKKIEDLLDLLIKYKQKSDNNINISINEEDKYSNKDINSLVNEILALERKHFNEKNNINSKDLINLNKNYSFDDLVLKSNQFFIEPILIMPNISNYTINTLYLKKYDLKKNNITKKDYNVHIGTYKIQYLFDGFTYKTKCNLYIENKLDVSFFPIQKKNVDSKIYEIIPMENIPDSNKFSYEADIDLTEFNDIRKDEIKIDTKIQIFSVIG